MIGVMIMLNTGTIRSCKMKKRSPIIVLLLSLVTLGIYHIYWLYITRKEVSYKLQNQVPSWPLVVLFSPFIVILLIVLLYADLSSVGVEPNSGINSLYFLVGSLAVLALIIIPFIWIYKFTKLISALTPQISNSLYLIWVILAIFGVSIIWPVIVQSHLNGIIDGQQPEQPALPPSAPPATTSAPYTQTVQQATISTPQTQQDSVER